MINEKIIDEIINVSNLYNNNKIDLIDCHNKILDILLYAIKDNIPVDVRQTKPEIQFLDADGNVILF